MKNRLALSLLVLLASLPVNGLTQERAHHPAVLQGSVHYREAIRQHYFSGTVTDAANGQPVGGAHVAIPAWGITEQTAANGGFSLPRISDEPVIARIEREGYLPATMTLDAHNARGIDITLSARQQTLVIDRELRHLGDGSYSPVSAGAHRFRKTAEGRVLALRFYAPDSATGMVSLGIGSVLGLDTRAAHAAGQSSFHHASTPLEVRLNGQPVGRVDLNGDGLRFPIASGALRPGNWNVLEIATGWQSPDGTYLDYDDMELMLVTLEYQADAGS